MPAAPSSNFNLPTFVVAAVGAATGLFAASWTVVQYVSAGSKIYVTIHYLYHADDGPIFEVNAYNKRRGPIEIRHWGVRTYEPRPGIFRKHERHYTTVYFSSKAKESDEVPKTIQGGHGASWRVPAKELTTFENNREKRVKIKGVVQLGNGKEKKSKSLKLQSGSLHQRPRIVE